MINNKTEVERTWFLLGMELERRFKDSPKLNQEERLYLQSDIKLAIDRFGGQDAPIRLHEMIDFLNGV